MTTIPKTSHPDERGFVLVLVLVTLLLLTVLGIWASRSAQIELRTANNERMHQDAFYQADAGTHLAERLIFHTKRCVSVRLDDCLDKARLPNGLYLPDLCFTKSVKAPEPDVSTRSIPEREYTFIYYPNLPTTEGGQKLYKEGQDEHGTTVYMDLRGNVLPQTIVRIGAVTKSAPGEDNEFGEDGTTKTVYAILSQHRSQFTGFDPGSEARVNVLWQLGTAEEGDVRYASESDCAY